MRFSNASRLLMKGKRSSLRTRLFFEAFFLLLLCIVATTLVAYILAKREFSVRSLSQLRSIVHSKTSIFEDSIANAKERIVVMEKSEMRQGISSLTKIPGFTSIGIADNDNVIALEGSSIGFREKVALLPKNAPETTATIFIPIVEEKGWTMYAIATPHMEQGERKGALIAFFDAVPLSSTVLTFEGDFVTGEIVLIRRNGSETIVLHRDKATKEAVRIYERERARSTPLIEAALSLEEGVIETNDYAGIPVLSAHRSLPSLGWSVVAKVDTYEVATPVLRLAMNLIGTGFMLVILLSLSVFLLAKRIVSPLEELSEKLHGLETKRWNYPRTIHTNDEMEDVDESACDLSSRLRKAYERLEEIIAMKSASLKKEFAENKTILESIDYGLMVTDEKGKVAYINRAGAELTGWSENDALQTEGNRILEILNKEGQPLAETAHPIPAVLKTRMKFAPPVEAEYSLRRKDGSATPLQVRATPILSGRLCLGVVVVFRDVTEERHIDHMKSEFISLVSHQLRTPLSSMRWYLEMLLSLDAGPLTSDQKEYVEEVASSNTRMVHLVNALLNVSRIELGKMQVSPESVDPRKLLEEIMKTFDFETKRKKLVISTEYAVTESMGIHSDRGLLQLIIENLLSNAIKYANESSEIRVEMNHDTKKKVLQISVKNEGIEIPEDQRQYIGKKLFRATNARLTNTDGNGLGLYISNVAADAIGARLDFESVKEVTTFTLTLPIT